MTTLGYLIVAIAWTVVLCSVASMILDYFRPTDDGGRKTKNVRFAIINGVLLNRRLRAIKVKE